jgi:hypothetical protein
MLVFLATIVNRFCYKWYYLYYSVFVIIDYSGILFSGSARGLVSTLLDTTLNLVSFSLCLLLLLTLFSCPVITNWYQSPG